MEKFISLSFDSICLFKRQFKLIVAINWQLISCALSNLHV